MNQKNGLVFPIADYDYYIPRIGSEMSKKIWACGECGQTYFSKGDAQQCSSRGHREVDRWTYLGPNKYQRTFGKVNVRKQYPMLTKAIIALKFKSLFDKGILKKSWKKERLVKELDIFFEFQRKMD